MIFRTAPANRPARIAAGLILLCFGLVLTAAGSVPAIIVGIALWGVGLWAICLNVYQAVKEAIRHRADPYDLSRLWEAPFPESLPEEPLEPGADADLVYCHRCGASMDETFKVCPDCGSRLGG